MFLKNVFKKKKEVKYIRTLDKADKDDLTFYDSRIYMDHAASTKASFCITTSKLAKDLPKNIEQLKKSLAEIKSLANLPEKKATPSYALLGFILCALGILVIGIIEGLLGFLLLLGGLLILLGGALTGSTSEKHEEVLVAAKKEVLRREE